MTKEIDQLSKIAIRPVSERLNQECFCITLDRDALCQALEREVSDPDFCATFMGLRGIEWESFAAEGLIKRCIV